MIEHIKSVILWVLVLTSVVLTWQIWTYQPEYDIRTDVEYFESTEIGEERSANDLLIPHQVIVHEDGDIFWVKPYQDAYQIMMEELDDLSIPMLRTGDSRRVPSMLSNYQGINVEIVFKEPMQGQWMHRLFDLEDEHFPLETVDRILFFENQESTNAEVSVRFISLDEANNVQADTDMSLNRLQTIYEAKREQFVPVTKQIFTNNHNQLYQDVKYLPSEDFVMNTYTYLSKNLDENDFISALFSDPEFVKSYPQGNETVYTDGNRMMSIIGNGLILDFAHPSTGITQMDGPTETSILRASLDFVNAHKGWTDHYVIDSWRETSGHDYIQFRLNIQGLPILGSNINREGFYTMKVTRSGNQIIEYKRSLFELNEEDFEIETSISLPHFEDVWSYIEASEALNESLIEDIKIGHYMNRQGSLVYLTPAWFIKERGSWHQVDLDAGNIQQGIPNREVE
ncbi:two-component system activity regulator YycH [Bacillus shivajii]|uniref:YycH family regulatory protein n=1 Tax=Bacillus shivajii TaxID=1983719 RepID=UPI001CFBDF53|nr:two-component system activity regulator YycH [Bacillus shivajii]UCZ53223.1 two-component system activity regulator YycH [Bacillus shivajii]